MSPRFAITVASSPVSDPWIDPALEAADRCRGRGLSVDVLHEPPREPDQYRGIVLHGIQYEAWVRSNADATRAHLAMSDVPDTAFTTRAPVTTIDWGWPAAAARAGHAAGVAAGGGLVGLISGPPVRTQRHVASAFVGGVTAAGATALVHALERFDDVESARDAVRGWHRDQGCRVVGHSADAAGSAAVALAQELGMDTTGFLCKGEGTLGCITSEIADVIVDLVAEMRAGAPPRQVTCTLDNGLVGFTEHRR